MTIFFLLLLFFLAITLLIFHQKKTAISFFSIAFTLLIIIGNGFLPAWLLTNLQAPYAPPTKIDWAEKNAIIILGAGTVKISSTNTVQPNIMSYSRIYQGAHQYLLCKNTHQTCTIIISGGDPLANGISEADNYKDALIDLGINSTDILVESQSTNTYQNAQFTSTILKTLHFDRIVLVTAGIHLKRSILYFAHFNTNAIPVSADYLKAHISVIPLGYNFAIADFAIKEYIGIARLYVYNFLGWNKNDQAPRR